MRTTARTAVWGVAMLIPFSNGVQAAAPDAGSILRDNQQRIEKETPLFVPNAPMKNVQPEVPAASEAAVHFLVKKIIVEGNKQFSNELLQPLLDALTNKEYTLASLETALGILSRYYWDHRFPLAYVYLPPQEIHDGVVKVVVVEGEYGNVHLENLSRTQTRLLEEHLDAERQYSVVDGARLESVLNRLKEMTGASEVIGSFSKGSELKKSDLAVKINEAPRFSGMLEANNFGSSYTGPEHIEGSLYWNNPLGRGDHADTKVLTSGHGEDFLSLGYTLPVGLKGWRVGVHYSRSRYQLGEEFESLKAHGVAGQWSINAHYPILFLYSQAMNLDLGLNRKALTDNIDFFGISTTKTGNSASLGINGYVNVNAVQRIAYGLTLAGGKMSIDTDEKGVVSSQEQSYSKVSYNFSHQYRLSTESSFSLNVNGQYAFKSLDSSEKMGLGGVYGVRAYRSGILSGDTGYVANLEWHYRLPSPWLTVGMDGMIFADVGEVRVNLHPVSDAPNKRDISGVGLGLTWLMPHDSTLQCLVAMRTRSDAVPTEHNASVRTWVQWNTRF
jgi:hemolysin activation/secretion protein